MNNSIKKTTLVLNLTFCQFLVKAQRVIDYPISERYNGPLPSSNEIISGLGYALICIIIGYIINKLSYKRSENKEEPNAFLGCLSYLIFGLALLFLFPLLLWIEAIAVSIMSLGFLLFLVFAVLLVVYLFIKGD